MSAQTDEIVTRDEPEKSGAGRGIGRAGRLRQGLSRPRPGRRAGLHPSDSRPHRHHRRLRGTAPGLPERLQHRGPGDPGGADHRDGDGPDLRAAARRDRPLRRHDRRPVLGHHGRADSAARGVRVAGAGRRPDRRRHHRLRHGLAARSSRHPVVCHHARDVPGVPGRHTDPHRRPGVGDPAQQLAADQAGERLRAAVARVDAAGAARHRVRRDQGQRRTRTAAPDSPGCRSP